MPLLLITTHQPTLTKKKSSWESVWCSKHWQVERIEFDFMRRFYAIFFFYNKIAELNWLTRFYVIRRLKRKYRGVVNIFTLTWNKILSAMRCYSENTQENGKHVLLPHPKKKHRMYKKKEISHVKIVVIFNQNLLFVVFCCRVQ